MTPTQEDHEAAARDPFEKIRRRADQGPYVVDTCHGMVGGPAVLGPTGITGFMQGEANQRKAEELALDRNFIWACGYEAAVLAGAAALSEAVRVAVERERLGQRDRHTSYAETHHYCAACDHEKISEARARSDAQATPAPEPVCKRCGNMHACGCGTPAPDCWVCRTQDSGLPTPGYVHDAGCPRGTPPETGEK